MEQDQGDRLSLRELISEEDLIKTHPKEMYNYLKSTLRYEIKVPVKKSDMMAPDFENFLEKINQKSPGSGFEIPGSHPTPLIAGSAGSTKSNSLGSTSISQG